MIEKKTVHYVASLARIYIEEEKVALFQKNLGDILQYIDQLSKLDVANVKPTSHVLDLENVFREDIVRNSLSQEEALSIAVEKLDGHYKVPKVIE